MGGDWDPPVDPWEPSETILAVGAFTVYVLLIDGLPCCPIVRVANNLPRYSCAWRQLSQSGDGGVDRGIKQSDQQWSDIYMLREIGPGHE